MDTIEQNEAVDSVTSHEEQDASSQESQVDEREQKIQELEEKLKQKSIEARLAKKEKKEGSDEPQKDISELEMRVIRAELKAEGIKDKEEIDLVIEKSKVLGVDPVDGAKDEIIQAILNKRRKEKQDQLATPGTSNRAAGSTRDTVDYWIAKGELPPADQVELRQKVVRKKRENAKRQQMFNH